MKRRTRTIGAIATAAVTASLGVGLAVGANAGAGGTTQTTPTTVPMPMHPIQDMGSMTTGGPHGGDMMPSADMNGMHAGMHQMMEGTVDDDLLAACDTAHATMAGSMPDMPGQDQTQHDAHHPGTGS